MVDLNACLEAVGDLVLVVDDDGTVRYQSPSVARVLGHDDDGLVGENVLEHVHPADREQAERFVGGELEGSHDSGEPDDGVGPSDVEDATDANVPTDDEGPTRFRVRHADGSWVDLEALGAVGHDPETGGAVLGARDVSDRVAMERERDRFEAILESLDDGVYAIDEDGRIVYVNESYASMKGLDGEALVGTDIYDYASDSAAEKIGDAREEMDDERGEVGVVEFGFSTTEGGSIPVELRFNTLTTPDREVERTGVVRDVSERRARERALRRKNDRLEEFAGIVSHDLRNPLNVAEGWLEVARDDCEGEALDKVATALDRMESFIGDLLTLAREGESVGETADVDLGTAVERSWDGVDTQDANLDVDTDRLLRADPSRLQQLLENLVRNAVEHGGGDVTVTAGDLSDGFFLEDDGPGLPPGDRDRIFEVGFTTAEDGTGFGLGIVEAIADAHGWRVDVADGVDGGARFEVTGVELIE